MWRFPSPICGSGRKTTRHRCLRDTPLSILDCGCASSKNCCLPFRVPLLRRRRNSRVRRTGTGTTGDYIRVKDHLGVVALLLPLEKLECRQSIIHKRSLTKVQIVWLKFGAGRFLNSLKTVGNQLWGGVKLSTFFWDGGNLSAQWIAIIETKITLVSLNNFNCMS